MSKRLFSRGDTIVEVLIAIAIVSLVLTVAFVSANRSSQANEEAQERTIALEIAQSQLEQLRVEYETEEATGTIGSGIFQFTNMFCMNDGVVQKKAALLNGNPILMTSSGGSLPKLGSSNDTDSALTYNPSCAKTNGITYNAAIDQVKPSSTAPNYYIFIVHVRWDAVQAIGHNEVVLAYKLDKY